MKEKTILRQRKDSKSGLHCQALLTGGRKKKKEKKELQINTQGEGRRRDKPGKR
jgi:hypothetical protein